MRNILKVKRYAIANCLSATRDLWSPWNQPLPHRLPQMKRQLRDSWEVEGADGTYQLNTKNFLVTTSAENELGSLRRP